tara:strand:- start:16117 stop:16293 length:177 start_codon:yes stop_codon:yes gene_type:complete
MTKDSRNPFSIILPQRFYRTDAVHTLVQNLVAAYINRTVHWCSCAKAHHQQIALLSIV